MTHNLCNYILLIICMYIDYTLTVLIFSIIIPNLYLLLELYFQLFFLILYILLIQSMMIIHIKSNKIRIMKYIFDIDCIIFFSIITAFCSIKAFTLITFIFLVAISEVLIRHISNKSHLGENIKYQIERKQKK